MSTNQFAFILALFATPHLSFASSLEKDVTNCFEAIKPWDYVNRIDARKVEVDGRKAYVLVDRNTILAFDDYTHAFGHTRPGKDLETWRPAALSDFAKPLNMSQQKEFETEKNKPHMQVEDINLAIPLNRQINFTKNDLFIPVKVTSGIPNVASSDAKKFSGSSFEVNFNYWRVESGKSILKDTAILAGKNVTVKKDGENYAVLHQTDVKLFQDFMVPSLAKLVKYSADDLAMSAHKGKVDGLDFREEVKWLKTQDLAKVAEQAKQINTACQVVLDLAVKSGSIKSQEREETVSHLSWIASGWGLTPIEKDPPPATKK